MLVIAINRNALNYQLKRESVPLNFKNQIVELVWNLDTSLSKLQNGL